MWARAWFGVILLLVMVQVRAGECPYFAIQVGKTTIDTIRVYCGEPERASVGSQSQEYVYSNFTVATGLRDGIVNQLTITDSRFKDENLISPGMLEADFRARFPDFEYHERSARDPATDNLYRFKNHRVAIIIVR